jgi:hypothetical protein
LSPRDVLPLRAGRWMGHVVNLPLKILKITKRKRIMQKRGFLSYTVTNTFHVL